MAKVMMINKDFTYIYLIQIEKSNFYKIGLTKNPTQRLNQLQSSNPHDLKLIDCIQLNEREKAVKLEKELHKTFIKYKVNREWFEFVNLDEWKIITKSFNRSETDFSKQSYINVSDNFLEHLDNMSLNKKQYKMAFYLIKQLKNNSIKIDINLNNVSEEVSIPINELKKIFKFFHQNKFLYNHSNQYIINPYMFFKGSEQNWLLKLEEWDSLAKEI